MTNINSELSINQLPDFIVDLISLPKYIYLSSHTALEKMCLIKTFDLISHVNDQIKNLIKEYNYVRSHSTNSSRWKQYRYKECKEYKFILFCNNVKKNINIPYDEEIPYDEKKHIKKKKKLMEEWKANI